MMLGQHGVQVSRDNAGMPDTFPAVAGKSRTV